VFKHTEDTSLYRVYNKKNVLLYVGISKSIMNRLSQHRRDKPWWVEVSTIRVQHFSSRVKAEDLEQKAIKKEKPLYNKDYMLLHLNAERSRSHAKLIANAVMKLQLTHKSLRKLSKAMNREDIPTFRKGSRWHPTSVQRLLTTIEITKSF